jgi:hypothetical protein
MKPRLLIARSLWTTGAAPAGTKTLTARREGEAEKPVQIKNRSPDFWH